MVIAFGHGGYQLQDLAVCGAGVVVRILPGKREIAYKPGFGPIAIGFALA